MPTLRWDLADDAAQPVLFPGLVEREIGVGEYRGLEFLHVRAKTIINEVPAASRMPFRYTINAYRGCSHACVYCFARPTHDYLGLGTGEDFDTKIVVKINAVARVWAETAPGRWDGSPIAMGTNTDPYQSAEGKYRLTRGIIEVLGERANPFSILTKSTLVLRDLDVLTAAAARTSVHVDFSIGTLDPDVWQATEPGTPHPARRMEAVARLNAAGIPSGVLVAPVLPGISDGRDQLGRVVQAAVEAGARFISPIMLHLRPAVRGHYLNWLAETRPDAMGATRRTIGRRGYASSSRQDALVTIIDELIEECGGVVRPRERFFVSPPAIEESGQLELSYEA